ncbi:TFP11-domain-containing protein [Wallemia mellicola]|nr:TFP11-domain-containing protein [Wallemia mellicola]
MGRSDYNSSSDEMEDDKINTGNNDLDAELDLFDNPYKRKRSTDKQADKEAALYGVFGDEYPKATNPVKGDRKDISHQLITSPPRAPQFVSTHKPETHDVIHDLEEQEDGSSASYSSSDEEERPKLEKEDDYIDEEPSKPHMGSQHKQKSSGLFSKPAEQVSRAELSREDEKHFASIQNSFGAKMLASMGWKAGYGLGEGGKGIAVPIEASKARPQGAGVGAVNERTRAQKMEAKRRGEKVSDDEEDIRDRRKKGEQKQKAAWKTKQPKQKTKTQHMTYEEVLEALGDQPQVETTVGPILDLTGAQPQEVTSSLASHLSGWTPTSDSNKLPELRHNIRLIADESRGQLEGLAREAKVINDRRKALLEQEKVIVKTVDHDLMRIERMKSIEIAIESLEKVSKEISTLSTPILDLFTEPIVNLVRNYSKEYEEYRLDEAVVGAIAPSFKLLIGRWMPLSDDESSSTNWIGELRKWKKGLIMNHSPTDKQSLVRLNDFNDDFKPQVSTKPTIFVMTPYESLIWTCWLPRLRAGLINDWEATTPSKATRVLEEWTDLLPQFIYDNMMDQLLLPKVMKVIDNWKPSSEHSLHSLVFPWLPYLGDRLSNIMDLSKRKLSSWLKGWQVDQGLPKDMQIWKGVLKSKEWDELMLRHVVPKLSSHLREELVINPRSQVHEPLEKVLEWKDTIRVKVFASIFSNIFIPKFVDTLYIWLVSPKPNYEQVAQWYSLWKGYFPDLLLADTNFSEGFKIALDLINQAMGLGDEAPKRLINPVINIGDKKKAPKKERREHKEATFFDVAKEFIEEHNLLLVSTRSLHRKGHMLYKVSSNAIGKGGVTVYIDDDAVWVEPEVSGQDKTHQDFIPMTLEMVVQKAISHE